MDEQRKKQRELANIINQHFAGENERVAYVLKRLGKPVSVRTIQSWLIDPERQSNRKLPEWVIPKLRSFVSDTSNSSFHEPIERTGAYAQLAEVLDKDTVATADRQIERHKAIRDKWSNASFDTLPGLMAELEIKIDQQDELFGMLSDSLREALAESESYESFKQNYKERREVRFRVFNEVRQIRHAIENKVGEFSDD
jgi:hypothetical protein